MHACTQIPTHSLACAQSLPRTQTKQDKKLRLALKITNHVQRLPHHVCEKCVCIAIVWWNTLFNGTIHLLHELLLQALSVFITCGRRSSMRPSEYTEHISVDEKEESRKIELTEMLCSLAASAWQPFQSRVLSPFRSSVRSTIS